MAHPLVLQRQCNNKSILKHVILFRYSELITEMKISRVVRKILSIKFDRIYVL